MGAAAAYQRYAESDYEYSASPSIAVVPGGHPRGAGAQEASALLQAARLCAVVLVVLAVLGIARVAIESTTVVAGLESHRLSAQIEVARSEGSSLEVSQSALSNPSRIRVAAKAMGMDVAEATTFVDLSGDVVVQDSAGNLSLAGSIAAAGSAG